MAEFSLIQLGELICGLVVSVLHGLENPVKQRASTIPPLYCRMLKKNGAVPSLIDGLRALWPYKLLPRLHNVFLAPAWSK